LSAIGPAAATRFVSANAVAAAPRASTVRLRSREHSHLHPIQEAHRWLIADKGTSYVERWRPG
jgi:hypothetical protein